MTDTAGTTEGSETGTGVVDGDGSTRPAVREYPPPGHIMRRLGISLIPDGHDQAVLYSSMPLPPEVFVDGHFRLAVMAITVDLAAGTLAVGFLQPDWTATFDLATHRTGEVEPGATVDGVTRLVRAGRNMIVTETTLTARGTPIAYGECTFSRLPRREGGPASSPLRTARYLGEGEAPLARPFADEVGFRRRAPGVVELDLSDMVRNSTGSIQGGVAGVAMEEAALHLAGPGAALDFLHVYYLSASRTGPFRATAAPLRTTGHGITGRIDLSDVTEGRLLAQGTFIAG